MIEFMALGVAFVIVSSIADAEGEGSSALGKFMGFFTVVGAILGLAYLLSG